MTCYRIGSRSLDLDTHELRDGDELVEIEPQAHKLLAHLLANRHRVVPKTELLDEVWGDRFVSESALTTRIKQCRRALGDDGRTQAVIRTIHGVGYRLVAEVNEEPAPDRDDSGSPPRRAEQQPVLALNRAVFGREREQSALEDRLVEQRLVTLTGPGGVGKSTLAAQRVALGLDGPIDDWWWCALADTRGPEALGAMVLGAMAQGQQTDADPTESALRALECRRAVLVLDNCEHVVGTAAAFASDVLRRCPEVRILATSRVPLNVPGESVLPLDPLELEAATACFCARALEAGVELDPSDPTVIDLCQRLDGIPLALELAAARARTLSTSRMVALLQDRFRLLADPAGDDEARHQSLLRTIEWSWQTLDPSDQQVLASLSVLVGSFSLDDAATVAGFDSDVIELADAVERLVRASLVTVAPGSGRDRRFRLLESIRDFAVEHLTDPETARRRHVQHFVDRAEAIDDGPLQSPAVDHGLAAMRGIWDNLRAAVGYAAEAGDTHSVRRIIRAVGSYSYLYLLFEVLDWCDHADARLDGVPDDEVPLIADVMAIQARLILRRGDAERARALAEPAHAAHESHHTVLALTWCDLFVLDVDRLLEGSARLRELSRSDRGMDQAFAEGFEAFAFSLGLRREQPRQSPASPLSTDGILGTFDRLVTALRLVHSDPERAARLFEKVIEDALEHDYRLLLNSAGIALTRLIVNSRPTVDGMRTVHRTLTEYRKRGMWMSIMTDVVTAARLLTTAGEFDVACRLVGARAASVYDAGLSEVDHQKLRRELLAADEERFVRLADEGAHLSPPDAADIAIAALAAQIDT